MGEDRSNRITKRQPLMVSEIGEATCIRLFKALYSKLGYQKLKKLSGTTKL